MIYFKESCKDLLLDVNVNPVSSLEYEINGEIQTITIEWLLDVYESSSDESQELFFKTLSAAVESKSREVVKKFFEDSGKLVLMAALSPLSENASL
ncbi:MAG: hypothetical protein GQ570_01205 [Helicobacteraceae bacterium]|nr:hypothetical protein [Helicobacteraceae bacterium]